MSQVKEDVDAAMTAMDHQAASSSTQEAGELKPEHGAYHNLDRAQTALQEGGQLPLFPLRLSSIRIQGAPNLRASFLASLCAPYLEAKPSSRLARLIHTHRTAHAAAGEPTSLFGLLGIAQSLGQDLGAFDVFDRIDATLQPASSSLWQDSETSQEEVDIVLSVRERNRVLLKSSTDIGNGEGSASVQGQLRNVFGGAEMLQGSATLGTRTRKAFNVTLSAPLLACPDHVASLTAYALDRDCTSWTSSYEGLRGVRAALASSTAPGVSHELAYEASWRHVGRLTPLASNSARRLAGYSLKSALSHTYARDTRDSQQLLDASRGALLKVTQELAGFGGDASHYKLEGEGNMARAFGRGWAWTLSARVGLLRTLNERPSYLSDRIQAGGPLSVRMFRHNGLGPKDGPDSLGGDAYWGVGASLLAPIPSKPDWPAKVQAFFNAGQLTQIDQTKSLRTSSFAPLLQPSVSAGVGLLYVQGPLRVELNAGLPLVARHGDGTRKGFALGIGLVAGFY